MTDNIIQDLLTRISATFPARPYLGAVTRYDGGPWPEELDEEKALYENLKDRSWIQVPEEFLRKCPSGYLFLTPEAVRAFLAAWLCYSLDHPVGDSDVREMLVYHFYEHVVAHLRPLESAQRETIRALFAYFVDHERSEFVRQRAITALTRLDRAIETDLRTSV